MPLSVRMSNPGKYRAKINEEHMFEFQDTMYYIDLYLTCTLQYFNKSIKCIYFFLKTGVHNLFNGAGYSRKHSIIHRTNCASRDN